MHDGRGGVGRGLFSTREAAIVIVPQVMRFLCCSANEAGTPLAINKAVDRSVELFEVVKTFFRRCANKRT